MGEVVLLSRRKAGYDTDRFFFEYKGKKIARFYGSRLTAEQAKSLFLVEVQQGRIREFQNLP